MQASETSTSSNIRGNLWISMPTQMQASETRTELSSNAENAFPYLLKCRLPKHLCRSQRSLGLFPYLLKCRLLKLDWQRARGLESEFPYPLKCGLLKPGSSSDDNIFFVSIPTQMRASETYKFWFIKLLLTVSIPAQMRASETYKFWFIKLLLTVSIPTQMWASETKFLCAFWHNI